MMTVKKVLLLEPPVTRPADFGASKLRIGVVPPLGLAYLAAVLENHHITVKIIDCLIEGPMDGRPYSEGRIRYGLNDDEIRKEIEQYQPDLVGASCLISAKVFDMQNVCRIAKAVRQQIVTVTGGSHPTMAYKEVLRDKAVDFVVLGEADHTLYELVEALNGEREIAAIDGLAYRHKDILKCNPKTRFIDNLDILPLPARHLLNMEKYLKTASPHSGIKRQPFTAMITSRGCPNKCGFCVIRNLWGDKARLRSAEDVLMEIEQLITDYGVKEIHFEDDNFTWDRERTKAIMNGIIDRGWDEPRRRAL